MNNLNMDKIIKRYNKIMMSICVEHRTINTRFSQDTEDFDLQDMVHECEYWLSCYYESGHCRCEDRFLSKEDYQSWVSETGKLKRFINRFKPLLIEE